MRKTIIKRVCLVSPEGERADLTDDFIGTLSDQAILDFLTQTGKTVWIGNNLYKIQWDNGIARHYRYEVYQITQYTKSLFDLVLDAVRRI